MVKGSVGLSKHDAVVRAAQIETILEQVIDEGVPFDSAAANPRTAEAVVRAFVRDNADLAGLKDLLVYHNSFTLLFNAALEELRQVDREQQLFEIVCSADATWWKSVQQDSPVMIDTITHRDLERILKALRQSQSWKSGVRSCPLVNIVDAKFTWIGGVEHYLGAREFSKAYDLLSRAICGLCAYVDEGGQPPQLRAAHDLNVSMAEGIRLFRVSQEVAAYLTRRLYEAMLFAGLVPPIAETPISVMHPYLPSPAVPIPGFMLASVCFTLESGNVRHSWQQNGRFEITPWVLSADGAKILQMAYYFRSQKRQ
jgi:hypothetical protein